MLGDKPLEDPLDLVGRQVATCGAESRRDAVERVEHESGEAKQGELEQDLLLGCFSVLQKRQLLLQDGIIDGLESRLCAAGENQKNEKSYGSESPEHGHLLGSN